MFCTLNYDICYILHLDVKFYVNLDGNLKFIVQSLIKSKIYGGCKVSICGPNVWYNGSMSPRQ